MHRLQRVLAGLRQIGLLDTVGAAVEFVTDGTIAYAWSELFGPIPQLVSIPVSGGVTTTIGEYTGGGGFQEDDALMTPTTMYWTGEPIGADGGPGTHGIYALRRSTGDITLVAAGQGDVIEQDDACLYWLAGQTLFTIAK